MSRVGLEPSRPVFSTISATDPSDRSPPCYGSLLGIERYARGIEQVCVTGGEAVGVSRRQAALAERTSALWNSESTAIQPELPEGGAIVERNPRRRMIFSNRFPPRFFGSPGYRFLFCPGHFTVANRAARRLSDSSTTSSNLCNWRNRPQNRRGRIAVFRPGSESRKSWE